MPLGLLYLSISWMMLTIGFCAIGICVQTLFRMVNTDADHILSAFWIGWSVILIILQLCHFFVPIDYKVFIVVTTLSIICLVTVRHNIYRFVTKYSVRNIICALLVFFLLSVIIASQAIGPIIVHDSGFYHIPSIRWISTYPIIPGLNNLNFRLEISSYFLFLSLIDIGYWSHRSHHLANGLLFLIIFLQILLSILKVVRGQNNIKPHDVMSIIYLIPLAILCRLYTSSPTPDIPFFIIGAITSIELCRILFSGLDPGDLFYYVFFVVLLSAIGFTIKLNMAFMGCLISAMAVGQLWYFKSVNRGLFGAYLGILAVSVFVTVIPWIGRSIILSGYPLYPWPYLPFAVAWKVPFRTIMEGWITLHNINLTLKGVINDKYIVLMIALPVSLAFLGIIVIMCRFKKITVNKPTMIYFIASGFALILFWFFTAPWINYAGASFWYLGSGLLAVAFTGLKLVNFKRAVLLTLLSSILIAALATSMSKGSLKIKFAGVPDKDGFYPIPSVEPITWFIEPGLKMYIPKEGYLCWDLPIPCIPAINSNLRLREKGNIEKGFKINENY